MTTNEILIVIGLLLITGGFLGRKLHHAFSTKTTLATEVLEILGKHYPWSPDAVSHDIADALFIVSQIVHRKNPFQIELNLFYSEQRFVYCRGLSGSLTKQECTNDEAKKGKVKNYDNGRLYEQLDANMVITFELDDGKLFYLLLQFPSEELVLFLCTVNPSGKSNRGFERSKFIAAIGQELSYS